MQCRYCGKPLGLLRKLADQEFCSAAHQKAYAQEQEALVLTRLLEARPSAVPMEEAAPPEEFVPIPPGPEFMMDGNAPGDEEYPPLEAGFLLEEPYMAAPAHYVRNGVVPVDASEYSIPVFPVFELPDPPMARYVPDLRGARWTSQRPIESSPEAFTAAPEIPQASLTVEPDEIKPAESEPPLQPAIRHVTAKSMEGLAGSFAIPARVHAKYVEPIVAGRSTVPATLPQKSFVTEAPSLFALGSESDGAPTLATPMRLEGPEPNAGGTEALATRSVAPILYTAMKPMRPNFTREASFEAAATTEPEYDETLTALEFAPQREWHAPRLSDHLFTESLHPSAREAGSVPDSDGPYRASAVWRPHYDTPSRPPGRTASYAGSSLSGGFSSQAQALAVAYAWDPIDDGIEPEPVAIAAELPTLPFGADTPNELPLELDASPLLATEAMAPRSAVTVALAIPFFEAAALEISSYRQAPPPLALSVITSATSPELAHPVPLAFRIDERDSATGMSPLHGPLQGPLALSYPEMLEVLAPTPRLAETAEGVVRLARWPVETVKAGPLPLLTLAAISKPAEQWVPHLVVALQPLSIVVRTSEPDFVPTPQPAEAALDHFETNAPRREPITSHATPFAAPRLGWATQPVFLEIPTLDYESLAVQRPAISQLLENTDRP